MGLLAALFVTRNTVKKGLGKWVRAWCGQSIHCVVASLVGSGSEWTVAGQSSNKGMIVADSVRPVFVCLAEFSFKPIAMRAGSDDGKEERNHNNETKGI